MKTNEDKAMGKNWSFTNFFQNQVSQSRQNT